jgi:hypothetical protein
LRALAGTGARTRTEMRPGLRAAFASMALAVALASLPARADTHSAIPAGPTAPAGQHDQNASIEEYRAHLTALSAIVDGCAKGRDAKSCDPEQVGGDDLVPLGEGANAERRPIRYAWLRVLLLRAQKPDETAEKPKDTTEFQPGPEHIDPRPPPATTSQLLEAAKVRLATDIAQIDGKPVTLDPHAGERAGLRKILAGRDFANLEAPTPKDSYLEKFGNWLNKALDALGSATKGASWLGRVLERGFILAVCVLLVWGLLQLERRWRVRLTPEMLDRPAPGAASARDWQLWLKDAQASAATGQWREAIHFAYWAAISRLESKRLWPADRARTPREYLALVAAEDARKPGLASLTGSFERTWYGGREADEGDYRKAEQLAEGLIAGTGSAGAAEGGLR